MTTSVPTQPTDQPAGEVLYCANHPDVETYLRCNKCNKPICLKCAVLTEVGYRCKECIREQQNVFYNAVTGDNAKAFAVAAGITLVAWPIAVLLFGLVGSIFWLISWIIAAVVGSGAGRVPGADHPKVGRQATWPLHPPFHTWRHYRRPVVEHVPDQHVPGRAGDYAASSAIRRAGYRFSLPVAAVRRIRTSRDMCVSRGLVA